MVGLEVVGSLLSVWEVVVLGLNSAMGSVWEIILRFWLILTSVLDEVGCITMTYLDLLLSQARTQRVECHYGNAQVEDANLGRPPLPIFH